MSVAAEVVRVTVSVAAIAGCIALGWHIKTFIGFYRELIVPVWDPLAARAGGVALLAKYQLGVWLIAAGLWFFRMAGRVCGMYMTVIPPAEFDPEEALP
jgi:hypothetical protein